MIPLILGAITRGVAGRAGLAGAKSVSKSIVKSSKKRVKDKSEAKPLTKQEIPDTEDIQDIQGIQQPEDNKKNISGTSLNKGTTKGNINKLTQALDLPSEKDDEDITTESDDYNGDLMGFLGARFDKLTSTIEAEHSKTRGFIEQIKEVTKENLQVNKNSLETQEDTQEFNEEQVYKAEHDKKEKNPGILSKVADKGKGLGKAVVSGAQNLNNKTGGGGILGMIGKLFAGGMLIKAAWPAIKEGMGKLVDLIAEKGPELIAGIWDTLKSLTTSLFNGIIKYGPTILENLISGLKTMASTLIEGIIKYGPKILDMLITGLINLATTAVDLIIEYGPKLITMLGKAIIDLTFSAVDFIIKKGPGLLLAIGKGVWSLIEMIVPAIIELSGKLLSAVGEGIWTLISHIPIALNALSGDMIGTVVGTVWDLVSFIPGKILELGSSILDLITEPFDELINKISGFASGLWESVKAKVAEYWPTSFLDLPNWLEPSTEKKVPQTNQTNSTIEMSGADSTEVTNPTEGIISSIGDMIGFFKTGGFTGEGDDEEVAGIVHKNEFVLSKDMLQEISDATTKSDKDALVKEAAGGRGTDAESAIVETIKEMEPSKTTLNYNGLEVTLNKKQEKEYLSSLSKIRKDGNSDMSSEMELARDTVEKSASDNEKENIVIKNNKKTIAKAANIEKVKTKKEKNPFSHIYDLDNLEIRKNAFEKSIKMTKDENKKVHGEKRLKQLNEQIEFIKEDKKIEDENVSEIKKPEVKKPVGIKESSDGIDKTSMSLLKGTMKTMGINGNINSMGEAKNKTKSLKDEDKGLLGIGSKGFDNLDKDSMKLLKGTMKTLGISGSMTSLGAASKKQAANKEKNKASIIKTAKTSKGLELKNNKLDLNKLKNKQSEVIKSQNKNEVQINSDTRKMAEAKKAPEVKTPEPIIVEKTNTIVEKMAAETPKITLDSSKYEEKGFMLLGNII